MNGIKKKKIDNQVYEFEKSNATRFTETNWYCDRVLLWDYQEKVIVKKSKWTGFWGRRDQLADIITIASSRVFHFRSF